MCTPSLSFLLRLFKPETTPARKPEQNQHNPRDGGGRAAERHQGRPLPGRWAATSAPLGLRACPGRCPPARSPRSSGPCRPWSCEVKESRRGASRAAPRPGSKQDQHLGPGGGAAQRHRSASLGAGPGSRGSPSQECGGGQAPPIHGGAPLARLTLRPDAQPESRPELGGRLVVPAPSPTALKSGHRFLREA